MQSVKLALEEARNKGNWLDAIDLVIDVLLTEFEYEREKLEKHDKVLFGNGDPTKSIIARIDEIERKLNAILKGVSAIEIAVAIDIIIRIIMKAI